MCVCACVCVLIFMFMNLNLVIMERDSGNGNAMITFLCTRGTMLCFSLKLLCYLFVSCFGKLYLVLGIWFSVFPITSWFANVQPTTHQHINILKNSRESEQAWNKFSKQMGKDTIHTALHTVILLIFCEVSLCAVCMLQFHFHHQAF